MLLESMGRFWGENIRSPRGEDKVRWTPKPANKSKYEETLNQTFNMEDSF